MKGRGAGGESRAAPVWRTPSAAEGSLGPQHVNGGIKLPFLFFSFPFLLFFPFFFFPSFLPPSLPSFLFFFAMLPVKTPSPNNWTSREIPEREKAPEEHQGWREGEGKLVNWGLVLLSLGCQAGSQMDRYGGSKISQALPPPGHKESLGETFLSSLFSLSGIVSLGLHPLNGIITIIIISTDSLP